MTLRCLESIAFHGASITFEVLVVDDCTPGGTPTELSGVEGIRLIRNESNLGFIGASNAGAASARGQFLVFLNNDTEVSAHWLDELVRTFEFRPDAGLVGSKLVYPDGRLQECGGIVWRDGTARNVGRLKDPDHHEFCHLREVDYCSGASICVPSALFRELGGFDSHFAPAYYEDADLAFRVRQAGKVVLVQPTSVVVHHEGISSGTDESTGTKRFQAINRVKFRERWAQELEQRHLPPRSDVRKASVRIRRPVLLYVDSHFPRPDFDAGSARLQGVLRTAQASGFEVRIHAVDAVHATPVRRSELEREGIQVVRPPHSRSLAAYLREQGDELDVVVLSRPRVFARYWNLVRRWARRAILVYDTVDLHFLRLGREFQLSGDRKLLSRAEVYRKMECESTRVADLTWVVSLAELPLLKEAVPAAKIRVLSNVLPLPPEGRPFQERKDLLFLGSFQHTPNVDAVKYFVQEVLPLVCRTLPDIRLRIVGSGMVPEVQALAGENVEVLGYVETLEPILDSVRLMVVPLRFGAGIKGKINTAMAAGLPVVTTAIGSEGMGLEDGHSARIVDDPEPFAQATIELYSDREAWTKIAQGGRELLVENFSAKKAGNELRTLFDMVAESQGWRIS